MQNLEEEMDDEPWGGRYNDAWEPPYRRGEHNRQPAEPSKGIQMQVAAPPRPLVAATQAERHHQPSQFTRRPWLSRDGIQSLTGEGSTHARTTATPKPTSEPPKFQPIRVSNAERSERSRRGLCWHCPEKWSVGHVCKAKMLCYVGEEEDEVVDLDDPEDGNAEEVITADVSHLHTMDGHPRSRPFHVDNRALMAAYSSDHELYEVVHLEANDNNEAEGAVEYLGHIVSNGTDAGGCTENPSPSAQSGAASASAEEEVDGSTETAALLALAARPVPKVLDELRTETASIPALVELTRKIQSGEAPRHFTWADGRRTFDPGGKPTPHAVIRWSDGLSATTWEPLEPMKLKFPNLFLEDKEGSNGGRVDTSTPNTSHEETDTSSEDPMGEGPVHILPDTDVRHDDAEGACAMPARELRPRKPRKNNSETEVEDETGDTSVPEACMVPGRELRPRRPMKYTS